MQLGLPMRSKQLLRKMLELMGNSLSISTMFGQFRTKLDLIKSVKQKYFHNVGIKHSAYETGPKLL